ncbi:MAG: prepilin-type N-terminal cleavage/methylation domain-containing protein [Deltaproteobacteria bacterium]|nr:prepilin-type N-terminal cleavage/methylation domain-containing protein [Deltaproteobacteria bacterium]MBI3387400.1 prepilin-type N-terminal cleavage/methylation domain-containing protein [Deltaproteobacteria bacterium]
MQGGITLNFRNARRQAGFSLIELMVVVAIVGILAKMSVLSYSVMRQRAFDRAALSDVLNAGKALEGLDSKATFSTTVIGPANIPNLPGPRVSAGTTLTVTRQLTKNAYVVTAKGSNKRGTLTFTFQNNRLTASSGKL